MVGAELGYVFVAADRPFDDGAFASREMKGQAHDLERKQQIGENYGGVDAEKLSRGEGDFSGEFRFLADFE